MWQDLSFHDPRNGTVRLEGCGHVLQQAHNFMSVGASMETVNALGHAVHEIREIDARRELKVLNGV